VAIEFKHGGRTWRADTPEEAIALRKKLEKEDMEAISLCEDPDHLQELVWTPDKVKDLLDNAGGHQRLFLKLLCEKAVVSSTKAIEKLGLKSEEAFAGVLSGLSKQLAKIGVKPWDLYTVRVSWDGKEKSRSFRLVSNFRWIAMQMGWPEKWYE
jgi:hypothetical protein